MHLIAAVLVLWALGASRAWAAQGDLPNHVPAPYTCVTNYYVDGSVGADSNKGTSPDAAWRTIRRAVRAFYGTMGHGGVCINVAPGRYSEYLYLGGMGGSADKPDGYLVFRSMKPLAAKLTLPKDRGNADHVVIMQNSAYIIFDGFEAYLQNSADAVVNGFFVQGNPEHITHHIKILNCLAHDLGGAGVAIANHTDYITAGGNTIYNTAGYTNGSPMTFYEAYPFDDAPGYHNFFTNNKIYSNRNLGSFQHTEGTGIIMDTLNSHSYANKTLIENNIISNNGGLCINVYKSDDVTVRFNTCYHNNQDPLITYPRGDIAAINANHTVIANNIVYTSPGPPAGVHALRDDPLGQSEKGNVWVNNLAYGLASNGATPLGETDLTSSSAGGAPILASDGNILGADPLFRSPPNDFSLKESSPAIGAASSAYGAPEKDFGNKSRKRSSYDLGALAAAPR